MISMMDRVRVVLGEGMPLVATGGGEEVRGTEYMACCWWTYRVSTRTFLIHRSLKGAKLVNVQVAGEGEYRVLPGGPYAILVIEGKYQSKGKWASEYYGHYFEQIYEHPALRVLELRRCYSSGGGQGGKIAVLALDLSKVGDQPVPIARIRVRLSSVEEGCRVLYSDGSTGPWSTEIEKMIMEKGKREEEVNAVVYRRLLKSYMAHGSIAPLPPEIGEGWVFIREDMVVFAKTLVDLFNKLNEMGLVKERFEEREYSKIAGTILLEGERWDEPNLNFAEVGFSDVLEYLKGTKSVRDILGR